MILFISRAPSFSPGNVEKDARILDLTARRLRDSGQETVLLDEDTFVSKHWEGETPRRVFSMGRKLATLMRLEQYGWDCVNAPQAVRNTALSRELTLMLLQSNSIAVPAWWAYEPEEDELFQCEPRLQELLPGWVKVMRPDGVTSSDVTFVATPLEADTAVITRTAEGVTDLVVTRHLEGDLLKVYAVTDGESLTFFRRFSPREEGYTKFGNECHNSPHRGYAADEEALRTLALHIARVLGLQVFGFDVLLSATGEPTVIDVNDWPSFSRFAEEAAAAIAALA